jgi:hypothetical protein
VDLALRVLKDPTALLDVHLAFPFAARAPRFRYEGSLSDMTPIVDYLPGAQSDRITVQNWVAVKGDDHTVLWSSMDAAVVSLGRLWPGYVSPAHRCVRGEDRGHAPLKPEDLSRGWIYSNLYNNNFQTNFAISQTNCVLFRSAFTTRPGDVSDAEAAAFGWQFVTPEETVFTNRAEEPALPLSQSFVDIGHPDVVLLACKQAEDGRGLILRLWNKGGQEIATHPRMPGIDIARVSRTSIAEEDTGEIIAGDLRLQPKEVATLRIETA